MSWSMRAGLALFGFGICGFALMALNPTSDGMAHAGGQRYALAISTGPELALDKRGMRALKPSNVVSERALSCEMVLEVAAMKIGSRCGD